MTRILAFCAASAEKLPRASLELLAAARRLSHQLEEAEIQALLMGPGVEEHGETLADHGAEVVFITSHPRLQHQEAEIVLGVLEAAVDRLSPDVVILPHDELSGGHVGPRLAYRLGAGIVTDCVGFEVESGTIRWLRPVYGGKAMAYMVTNGSVQLATIRSRAFEPLRAAPASERRIRTLEVDVDSMCPQVRVVGHVGEEEEFEGLSLDQAEIIVSGGRGMEGKEGFSELRELADVLGAAVGGSRPAADLGWVPHSHLVGQTGKIVAPNVYIAVAISGAPQHMAGAGSARTIVAINKDEDAPIFKVAHIGVVGGWQSVVPALTEASREMLGS